MLVKDLKGGELASKTAKRVRIRVYDEQTPEKPQSRSEARESGAKGVLDGGILSPAPPTNGSRISSGVSFLYFFNICGKKSLLFDADTLQ